MSETARNSINTFDKILKLQKRVEDQLQTLGRRCTDKTPHRDDDPSAASGLTRRIQ